MLSTRQGLILKLIVEGYVSTAAPVASDTLSRQYPGGVSPATVRKEVADLEELGYLDRPHTSSGCVPLDSAYRVYVESLPHLQGTGVSKLQRASVEERLMEVEADVEEWTSRSSAILADLASNMALVTFPKEIDTRIRHIQLVRMQELLAMLIVVLGPATLRRHLVRLDEPLGDDELESSANHVKSLVVGLTPDEIEPHGKGLTRLEEELVKAATLILEEETQATYHGHYVDGLRNLLTQPEFTENDTLRTLIEGLEDGSLIEAILDETPMGGVVRVIIGRENRGDVLWPLSLVVSQYGVPGRVVGALGAVGPTRMEYSRTIAGVRLLSTLMSDMVEAGRVG
ncbi:MAG: heat-inducible transcriptional repressor HrcA [Chloroflexi bacterium]|nr:heat-inducible transcriptional repressor HrcA [Chloroflexota bacterium]